MSEIEKIDQTSWSEKFVFDDKGLIPGNYSGLSGLCSVDARLYEPRKYDKKRGNRFGHFLSGLE
jgi:hypothetical protein